MTGLEATLKAMGIKPSAFAEMLGRDVRTVRRWCREGAPIEVRALLAACETLGPLSPDRSLAYVLRAAGGDDDGKGKPDAGQ